MADPSAPAAGGSDARGRGASRAVIAAPELQTGLEGPPQTVQTDSSMRSPAPSADLTHYSTPTDAEPRGRGRTAALSPGSELKARLKAEQAAVRRTERHLLRIALERKHKKDLEAKAAGKPTIGTFVRDGERQMRLVPQKPSEKPIDATEMSQSKMAEWRAESREAGRQASLRSTSKERDRDGGAAAAPEAQVQGPSATKATSSDGPKAAKTGKLSTKNKRIPWTNEDRNFYVELVRAGKGLSTVCPVALDRRGRRRSG